MQRIAFIVVALFGIHSASAAGAIYKWIDHHGQIHFADSPPSLQQAHKVVIDVRPSGYIGLTPGERATLRRQRKQAHQLRNKQRATATRAAQAQRERAANEKRCRSARRRLEQYWDERHRGCKPRRCRRIDHGIARYRQAVGKSCR